MRRRRRAASLPPLPPGDLQKDLRVAALQSVREHLRDPEILRIPPERLAILAEAAAEIPHLRNYPLLDNDPAPAAPQEPPAAPQEPPGGGRRGGNIHRLKLTRAEREELAALETEYLAARATRPRTRVDCAAGPRPCPWVSCKYHLYLDVNPETGSVKLNFPADVEVDDLLETCALDVADRGGVTLKDIGDLINVERERVRQIEEAALEKARTARVETGGRVVELRFHADHIEPEPDDEEE